MIHYTCDLCKRDLDPEVELRFVVRIEISAAFDPIDDGRDDDRDYLQEIQDILERLEDAESDQIGDEVLQQIRLDLCPDCRKQFLNRLLMRESAKLFDFSKN
ncbi:MAG: hypothetical protein ACOX1P_17250 [Thermoguttaceae bacterium]